MAQDVGIHASSRAVATLARLVGAVTSFMGIQPPSAAVRRIISIWVDGSCAQTGAPVSSTGSPFTNTRQCLIVPPSGVVTLERNSAPQRRPSSAMTSPIEKGLQNCKPSGRSGTESASEPNSQICTDAVAPVLLGQGISRADGSGGPSDRLRSTTASQRTPMLVPPGCEY